ncbi:MAG TPA: GNAT family N-acetyltransferase [Kofleriaceae bacterium]|jgi:GNAT superfamily N-acetyltransferase|nr:GNAT family N-acetyltransferase [Kofleriaceae bacterium]
MRADVEIVAWRPELRGDFERLNRAWLEEFELLEDIDRAYLQRPEALILAAGGQIFFALAGQDVVGTCAAIRVSETVFELAKLAVSPSAQNRGVGRRLCETVIELARRSGASRVVLTSNQRLTPALRLYRALGFHDAPVPDDTPYVTADVYMVLELDRT